MTTLPISSIVLDRIRAVALSARTFLKASSVVIFACGAKADPNNPTGRDRLLTYAERHLSEFHFLVAEKFFSFFENKTKLDLLTIEKKLAQFSDCIIIILESPSTFAELGAFAVSDELARIILVVNDIRFIGSDSFIAKGPLAKVDRKSLFKPVIHVNLESILTAASEISSRLAKIERKNNVRVDFSTFEEFERRDQKEKTLFLLDLVALFSPLRESELIEILKFIFGDHSFDLRVEIGLLAAFGFVKKRGEFYYRSIGDATLYFHFQGLNVIRFRSDVVNSYYKYSRARLDVFKGDIS